MEEAEDQLTGYKCSQQCRNGRGHIYEDLVKVQVWDSFPAIPPHWTLSDSLLEISPHDMGPLLMK